MSKGGRYKLDDAGNRVLVQPATIPVGHPDHADNKPAPVEVETKKPGKPVNQASAPTRPGRPG